jgi:hypothetical protein
MLNSVQYPERWEPLPFDRRFTAAEYDRMSLCLISEPGDESWGARLEGETSFFYRWTGICMFRMRLQKVDDGFLVAEAAVARYAPSSRPSQAPSQSPGAYRAADIDLLTLLVDVGLLGKPDPRVPGQHSARPATGEAGKGRKS